MSSTGSANDTVVNLESGGDDRLEQVATMKLVELKDELKSRKLKTSGKKEELQCRLRAAIMPEIEHGDVEEEEKEEEAEDEEDDVLETRSKVTKDRTYHLTFKDVEESMNTFSGDDNIIVRSWLEEFE